MRRRLLATALVAVAVAALLAPLAVGGPTRDAACSPGVRAFDGATRARTFCGPARATVKVAGTTFGFTGGTCEKGPQYVALNIGTVVLGTTAKRKPEYFGLVVGKAPMVGGTPAPKDGTYTAQAVTWVHAGAGGSALQAKVTLQGNRTKGTFTGRLLGAAGTATGTFAY